MWHRNEFPTIDGFFYYEIYNWRAAMGFCMQRRVGSKKKMDAEFFLLEGTGLMNIGPLSCYSC